MNLSLNESFEEGTTIMCTCMQLSMQFVVGKNNNGDIFSGKLASLKSLSWTMAHFLDQRNRSIFENFQQHNTKCVWWGLVSRFRIFKCKSSDDGTSIACSIAPLWYAGKWTDPQVERKRATITITCRALWILGIFPQTELAAILRAAQNKLPQVFEPPYRENKNRWYLK